MFYNGLSKNKILEIYSFVMSKRRKEGIGQRKLYFLIREKFNVIINEGTISNWIFYNKIPFNNERTQFKPLPKPNKKEIYDYYIKRQISAQKIAEIYKISTATVINWIKDYQIKLRNHRESMNTPNIKKELSDKALTMPQKDFSVLTPEKAYIFGVLCGDACINKKAIRLEIRKDEEFIQKFVKSIKEVYGLNYKYKYYLKRNSLVLYISSQVICKDLLGYGKFKTFEWRVPREIMKSNDEIIICPFLKGFYDSEGYVSKGSIGLTSANKNGVKEVSLLLEKIGIKNKIYSVRKGKYYSINILRRERFKIFKDKIGFTIQRKQDRLNEILKNDRIYKPAKYR